MRHLKTYRIFESVEEHIRVLTDMTLSLRDKDFSVNVYKPAIAPEEINITIIKMGFDREHYCKEFSYSEIKDELLEMIDYMDLEGWEILDIEITNRYRYCSKLDLSELNDEPIEMIKVSFVEK